MKRGGGETSPRLGEPGQHHIVCCAACRRYVMVPPPMLASLSIALLSLSTLRDAAAFVPSSSLLRTGNSKHDLGREPDRRGRTQTAMATDSVVDVKAKVLQLAAVTDRGGMADPGKAVLGSSYSAIDVTYTSKTLTGSDWTFF